MTASAVVNVMSGDIGADGPKEKKPPVVLTPEQIRMQKLKEKLHLWVYALVSRLRLGKNDLTPNEAKFVRDGKASIRVVLTEKPAETIEKLKALGMEVEPSKDGVNITGRIAVEKLAALAEIGEVKLILPRTF